VDDYYSILGLDPGASRESIKVAYRRLARETHPDRKTQISERDKSAFSAQMAELNEAYAVLSDAKRRREYDDKVRIQGILSSNASAHVDSRTGSGQRPAPRVAVRPRHDVDPAVVKEFSNHLRASFVSDRENFSWKQTEAEGFDWALQAVFWSSHYLVAARGSATINSAIAKKLINYSEIVMARCNRPVRKSHFLFLFPFQQLTEWELVSAQCQRFTSKENRPRFAAPTGIILLDMQHGRTLRFSNQIQEKRFAQLLQRVETPA
jgi:DnaJ domain